MLFIFAAMNFLKTQNIFTPSKEKCDEATSELKERMFKIWEQMLIDTEFVQTRKTKSYDVRYKKNI